MKKLKISICALLVLFSGFIFAACGEQKQDFNVDDFVVVGDFDVVYDGQSHVFAVKYNNVDLDVTYSLNNKSNFKSKNDIGVVDAGTYNLYYKVSALGYNDYVSDEAITVTIAPKDVTVTVQDYTCLKRDLGNTITPDWRHSGIVSGDSLNIGFEVSNFNSQTAQAGDTFTLRAYDNGNTNYNISFIDAVLIVKDDIELLDASNQTIGYYSDLAEAVETAVDGQTIKLFHDVEISETLKLEKSITIDGQGKYGIKAADNFDAEAINVFALETNKIVTFKDVDVDANQKGRIIKVSNGRLILDGANLTGGKLDTADGTFASGVFITAKGQLQMNGGSITNNVVESEDSGLYYVKYSTDLWIGANAQGTVQGVSTALINGGTVGNVFVNANSFSATDAGSFTMNGGNIDNLYVEYFENYGATFDYKTGRIGKLMIATGNTDGDFVTVAPEENRVYTGGALIEVVGERSSYYQSLNLALQIVENKGKIRLHKDVFVDETINFTKSVTIDGQNKFAITASNNFNGVNMFTLANSEKVVEFKDLSIDANKQSRIIKVSAGLLSLENSVLTGGYLDNDDATFASGVFITNSGSFRMNGGSITGNTLADDHLDKDVYKAKYSTDLWIGANAIGSMVEINGEVGNVFVNANEYSANNPGSFTMENGTIANLYVEYYKNYGATFNLVSGTVQNLMIATGIADGDFITVDTVNAGKYVGGSIVVDNGTEKTGYLTLHEAIYNATVGSTIALYKNVELNSTLTVDKSVIIDSLVVKGERKYSIIASDSFSGREVIAVANKDVVLTLRNIDIDANEHARVIKVSAGTLKIDGANITGGKTNDSYIGGVYVTGSANFQMTSGSIVNNYCSEEYSHDNYLQYSADLWIGANAVGSLASATITGGVIGNVFVNANEFSGNNPGYFTISGGTINNIYLEYDAGFAAKLNVEGGAIENLINAGAEMIANPTAGTYYGYNKNN